MKCTRCTLAIGFALLLFAGSVQPAAAQQSPIKIAYEVPTDAKLRPIYDRLKQRAVLEELQVFLSPLRLPRQFTVRTAQCGTMSVRYVAGGPATVCYEMVDAVEKLVVQHTKDDDFRQTVIMGAFIETVLHETARAIFDVLQIPIWGREKDAADRLAALIMTQFGEDVTRVTILGTANLFMWSDKKWTGSDFSDTASPEYQRFFNYVCVAYVAAPLQFGDLVDRGILPKRRAARCEGEYEQIRKAFNLRIMPYVDPELLIKARATPWLAWKPGK
jgi:Putative metallopeptidase